MGEFTITTENTCNLSEERLSALGAKETYLRYFLDGAEIPRERFDAKEFYGRLRAGSTGSTSQPNEQAFVDLWTPLLEAGSDILHLAFSKALSGTYDNACRVGKRLEKQYPGRRILVLDTKSQSCGQGFLVQLVSERKAEGRNIDECLEYAKETLQRINHIFTINDLRCLASTGRVSNSKAFIGNLLQIKPLLYTNEAGELTPYQRAIGRKAALNELIKKARAKFSGERAEIWIVHSDCMKDVEYAIERLKPLEAEIGEKIKIEVFDLNPVIGYHTGPDTLGIFFLSKTRDIREKK